MNSNFEDPNKEKEERQTIIERPIAEQPLASFEQQESIQWKVEIFTGIRRLGI